MRSWVSSWAIRFSSRPFSTKAREVRIVSSAAARQAARMLAAPEVKLIIAGTRPADMTAKKVTTPPLEVGSITPMVWPSRANGINFRPKIAVACNSRR
jgi:hypothetical protein